MQLYLLRFEFTYFHFNVNHAALFVVIVFGSVTTLLKFENLQVYYKIF